MILPEMTLARSLKFDLNIPADFDERDIFLRYWHAETKQVALRKLHNRHRLRVRSRPRLDQRAHIRVAHRNDAVERSGNNRVVLERLNPLVIRFRNPQLLFGGFESRLGDVDFASSILILGPRVIQLLLCNQPGRCFDASASRVYAA